tara:strand:- start:5874 stop:7658 length:1785 start_codon:yes stop_codon:yes gene_type:complete
MTESVAEKNIIVNTEKISKANKGKSNFTLQDINTGLKKVDEIVVTKAVIPSYFLKYNGLLIKLDAQGSNKQDYRNEFGYINIHSAYVNRENTQVNVDEYKADHNPGVGYNEGTEEYVHYFNSLYHYIELRDSLNNPTFALNSSDTIIRGLNVNVIADHGTAEDNFNIKIYLNSRWRIFSSSRPPHSMYGPSATFIPPITPKLEFYFSTNQPVQDGNAGAPYFNNTVDDFLAGDPAVREITDMIAPGETFDKFIHGQSYIIGEYCRHHDESRSFDNAYAQSGHASGDSNYPIGTHPTVKISKLSYVNSTVYSSGSHPTSGLNSEYGNHRELIFSKDDDSVYRVDVTYNWTGGVGPSDPTVSLWVNGTHPHSDPELYPETHELMSKETHSFFIKASSFDISGNIKIEIPEKDITHTIPIQAKTGISKMNNLLPTYLGGNQDKLFKIPEYTNYRLSYQLSLNNISPLKNSNSLTDFVAGGKLRHKFKVSIQLIQELIHKEVFEFADLEDQRTYKDMNLRNIQNLTISFFDRDGVAYPVLTDGDVRFSFKFIEKKKKEQLQFESSQFLEENFTNDAALFDRQGSYLVGPGSQVKRKLF